MISKELKERLSLFGVDVTKDECQADMNMACVKHGCDEEYVSYDGTDDGFMDELEDTSYELFDIVYEVQEYEAREKLADFHMKMMLEGNYCWGTPGLYV